jgi:hypothetical protein
VVVFLHCNFLEIVLHAGGDERFEPQSGGGCGGFDFAELRLWVAGEARSKVLER